MCRFSVHIQKQISWRRHSMKRKIITTALCALALSLSSAHADASLVNEGLELYNNGKISEAKILWEKAGEEGHMSAYYNLGLLYYDGEGVSQDKTKAKELWDLSCDGGYILSCTNLGYMYNNGDGVRQDVQKATELYDKACNAGSMNACYNLGNIYYKGKGPNHRPNEAKALYGKACDYGHKDGCSNFKALNEAGY